jgi:hypothetical protein
MMSRTVSRWRASAPLIAALLLGTTLAACNRTGGPDASPSDSGSADADAAPATLPLSTSGTTTPVAAPPVTALPVGHAIGLRRLADRQQGYGWLDQADYQGDAVEDAPPDYAFDDGGVRPWTWTSGDGARVITEPVAGGYRTYYYEAGAQQPYLVRDPNYSYAYENGALVAVFTLAGALLDPQAGSEQANYAARYFDRGTNLWRAADSGPHVSVNAYTWADRRADLAAQRVAWQSHVTDNPDWSAWNSAHSAAERSRWNDVRAQHQAAAQQFVAWQQQKFQGPPPKLYEAPQRPQLGNPDNRQQVVGGAVAGAAAAVAAHAVIAHQPAQHQTGMPPAAPHQPGMAAQPHRPETAPGNPHAAPPAAQHAAHAAAPRPEAAPAVHHAAPMAAEHPAHEPAPRPEAAPAVHHAPPHAMDHQPERPAAVPEHTAAPKPHPEERPHDEPHHEH